MSDTDDVVDYDETSQQAYDFAAGAGEWLADTFGIAGEAAALPIKAAAATGVAIGTGLEYLTDGAISDAGSDALGAIVGEEESYAAAQAWDDGDYWEVAGHMVAGGLDTAGEAIADGAGWVADSAGDVGEALGDAAEEVGEFFEDLF